MPPAARFVPRFAAEPPQDRLPYGQWERTLAEEFLAACLRIDSGGEDPGEPGEIAWYPDRSWAGRTYVPATTLTSAEVELFGHVSFVPGTEDSDPDDFRSVADSTAETAERHPEWRLDR